MRPGYLTPDQFQAINRFDSMRLEWSLADPSKAIDCPPFEGDWQSYFNAHMRCGQPGFEHARAGRNGGSCGARDWRVIPSGVWVTTGGHTIRCNSCGETYEVLVVADKP